ncbi:baseplate J/gp47 family protein [Fictibacillus sp. JL2B1089]|uniref:baseplate J/gp47 family protein n=1 Tax=Fictibacillus sp. JL2B1089 TaxID=3399565 RepID=UPI003A8585D8
MLDRFGFRRKNYAELQTEMEERAKTLFGEDANLSERSPLGIFIRLFSWFISKTWELAEKVYNSAFITKAEGIQLDRLTAFFNTSRNPEQFAIVDLSFSGVPNSILLEGTRFETESGIDYALTENVTLDLNGLGNGSAVCLTAGIVGNVPSGSIIVQSEPSADIYDVTNPLASQGGRDEETDAELLARLKSSGANVGSGTPDAIVSSVLGIAGVRAANISVNNANTTVNGQPPHSNAVYVLGGEGQIIADTLFNHYVGLQFFGTDSYVVKDISGNSHTISFTPATQITIFSNVTLTTDNTFTTTGVTEVKDSIVRIIGGASSDGTLYVGLNMGEDVIYSKILAAVMGIQGVVDATVTIGMSAGAQGTSNLAINTSEVAQIDADNILVTV